MDQEIWFYLVSVSLILYIQTNPNYQSKSIMMKKTKTNLLIIQNGMELMKPGINVILFRITRIDVLFYFFTSQN